VKKEMGRRRRRRLWEKKDRLHQGGDTGCGREEDGGQRGRRRGGIGIGFGTAFAYGSRTLDRPTGWNWL